MAKLAESYSSLSLGSSCLEVPGDRISNLPDEIKRHIISLLDTKDAVSTTVLSTKWKNLWITAIKDIVLDDSLFNCRTVTGGELDARSIKFACVYNEDKARKAGELESNDRKFAQFVNTVLRFHDVLDAKRFSLHCVKDGCSYDVNSWVEKAISKKIEELDLYVECDVNYPCPVPSSIFTCETLRVLKLQGPIFVRIFTCHLPRLQELVLTLVHFRNESDPLSSCPSLDLLSSCPSLESLIISRETLDGVEFFTISSSTLKNLRIDQTFCSGSTVIDAPALQHLDLCNGPPIRVNIRDNLTSLVTADVSLSTKGWEFDTYADDVSKLLHRICNVQMLNVSGETFLSIIPAHLFPKFDRLSELQVEIKCCDWNPLQEFIRNSDRLEVILFRKVSCKEKACKKTACELPGTWRNTKTVPFCLLSSIKRMAFYGFVGKKDELTMVDYILKNAMVMQEMEIHFGPSLQKPATQLHKELLEIPLGSEKCQVTIS